MNPVQVTAAINKYKNTIHELQQSMIQNKKNIDILISNKDEELSKLQELCCQKDEELSKLQENCNLKDKHIEELKQEIADLLNCNDKQTIQSLNDNNITFKKSGPFILLT